MWYRSTGADDRSFGVPVAMRHRLQWFIHVRAHAYEPILLTGYDTLYLTLLEQGLCTRAGVWGLMPYIRELDPPRKRCEWNQSRIRTRTGLVRYRPRALGRRPLPPVHRLCLFTGD